MFHFYFRASLKTLTVLQGKHSSNEGAITIVQHVDEKGIAALIHCSDGWDRTAQLSSISQILLDPYYRTIKRFQLVFFKICGRVYKVWMALFKKRKFLIVQFRLDNLKENILADILPFLVDAFTRKKLSAF
ncbi:myotubularin-related protein 1-like isoform X1 [Xenia sp. Carnegie-2017]|uniref:myotubularin-related protein 1-like isoform X1 n=1 Tax=Xenia sp. Carnegie-2017 TaxID=2897299 RepID=UPI001F035B8C|nr:myotubularin-related protein 1-like isoform X1 [Xenia sp. Carnegie-2017]